MQGTLFDHGFQYYLPSLTYPYMEDRKMKKVMFALFVSIFFVLFGLQYAFGQFASLPWNYWYQDPYYAFGYQDPYYNNFWYQQSYYPWEYQQPYYNNYWYQEPYYNFSYQQSYYPWGYQQSYNPWGYQQPYYNNFWYQEPYYNLAYQQSYYPWGYQQSYYSPWSYSWGTSTVDVCGIPGTGLYGKPAIYLYPQDDTYISIELEIDGQLTRTIPSYDEGWYVLGKPNGDIFDMRDGYIQDMPYDYLFWEAETDLSTLELPDEGWIVAKGNLETWFSENLPLLGLNEKEKVQFMEYWLEMLTANSYYEIKLLSSEFLAEHATLIITPQPDTLIRVIFYFRPLDEPMDEANALEPPVIDTPKREGFVVLEWGGILGN